MTIAGLANTVIVQGIRLASALMQSKRSRNGADTQAMHTHSSSVSSRIASEPSPLTLWQTWMELMFDRTDYNVCAKSTVMYYVAARIVYCK